MLSHFIYLQGLLFDLSVSLWIKIDITQRYHEFDVYYEN